MIKKIARGSLALAICFASYSRPVAVQDSVARGESGATYRPVPKVDGKRADVAEQLLRLSGFEMAVGVYYIAPHHWRDDIQEGVIYLQAPRPTSSLKTGETVACWTFKKALPGQKVVEVPKVHGKEYSEAEKLIREAGLLLLVTSSPPAESLRAQVNVTTGTASPIVDAQYPRSRVFEKTGVFLRLKNLNKQ